MGALGSFQQHVFKRSDDGVMYKSSLLILEEKNWHVNVPYYNAATMTNDKDNLQNLRMSTCAPFHHL